jgi:acyl carrier protein
MNADEPGNTPIRDRILEAVLVGKISTQVAVGDHEDVFAKFGLNSLETFQVLVRLEKMFDIVIGEEPTEFDRIRTLGGFSELVTEKVRENALEPGLSAELRA